MKRASHGTRAGTYIQRMTRGPSGSVSQPGTLRTVPGIDIGTTDEPLKHPALPNDAPSPGAFGSSNTTSCPLRSRKLAVVTPTTPAPITATVFLPPLLTLALPSGASCRNRLYGSQRAS